MGFAVGEGLAYLPKSLCSQLGIPYGVDFVNFVAMTPDCFRQPVHPLHAHNCWSIFIRITRNNLVALAFSRE